MNCIVLDKDGGKLNLKSGSDEIYLTMPLLDTIVFRWVGQPVWRFYTTNGSSGYWDMLLGGHWFYGTEITNRLNGLGFRPSYVRMYFDPNNGWSGTLKTQDIEPYDRMNGMLFIDLYHDE